MKKNIFKPLFFILLIVLVLLSVYAGARSMTGNLSLIVFSPFGTILMNETASLKNNDADGAFMTDIKIGYEELKDLDSDTPSGNPKPYCKLGGAYRVQNKVVTSAQEILGNANINYTLFYCKTTKDLIDKIKIPTSWNNSNLVLYCNDGGMIDFVELSADFLTSLADYYKICVLKNLDKEENNTIIYGFEVGNADVDNDSGYFYNHTDEDGNILGKSRILSGLEFVRYIENISAIGYNLDIVSVSFELECQSNC